ncbi:MAG: Eco57I restriction-modification methylase domain-containing protein [Gammaproteobacteria bacterium]
MNEEQRTKIALRDALAECGRAPDFGAAAERLLNALEYKSERKHSASGNVREFVGAFPASRADTAGERRLVAAAASARILFQYTGAEIAESGQFFDAEFDGGDSRSFLFFAVELKRGKYARGQYAEFAREINRRFNAPVVVLFRAADAEDKARLSLAFVGRRANKIDPDRDVLEKVSLLRGVDCANPHRGHLDVLAALSLKHRKEWMRKNGRPRNFDGLLAAWLDELNTDALNKRFYGDLLEWFDRAREEIKFPDNLRDKRGDWVIRLITRLLFIWFIREKHLVAEALFTRAQIAPLLKNGADGDSYYRVVLQNLFFATLNTPIRERRFSPGGRDAHRDFSLYRYRGEIAEGREDELLSLFAETPFINGGLFDCLDDYEGVRAGGERTDYFSDAHGKQLSLPDRLFFDDDDGLLSIFHRYKFTVEESTPIEQEVALDPELLGRVFENLLAVYNPETGDNARRQTGSFYTPREIVDYMARESLAECLAAKAGTDLDATRDLLDYAAPAGEMSAAEKKSLVRAIAEIKIFDPAAGSGAFPTGVLHLLTLALSKLDPQNKKWSELHRERARTDAAAAFNKDDQNAREERLREINDIFARYSDSDFGRKLFLIQNCIFGADIQPVACQIAKLRFFISLAIEQTPDENADNFGIKPLPNLETRFVAADTLLQIGGGGQARLKSKSVAAVESELSANRERHFNATDRGEKLRCREKDAQLREKLARGLAKSGDFGDEDAQKIARWNPYDQNAVAHWFDAEYMFGVADGFDIVIGNPPYVKTEHLSGTVKKVLKAAFDWADDLYAHFIFKGMELTQNGGILSYVTNDSFIAFDSKRRVRDLLLDNKLLSLVKCPPATFDATIYVAVFMAMKQTSAPSCEYRCGVITSPNYACRELGAVGYGAVNEIPGRKLLFPSPMLELYLRIIELHDNVGTCLHVRNAGIHSGNVRDKVFFAENISGKLNRLLQGRQIGRFFMNWNAPEAQYKFCNIGYKPRPVPGIGRGGVPSKHNEYWTFQADIDNHHQPERLLIRQTGDGIVAAYHSEQESGQFYTDNTLYTVLPKTDKVNLQYAMAILNGRLINALYQFVVQEKGKTLAQVKVRNITALPFVAPTMAEQRPFIKLAEKITAAKAADPTANTTEWEKEIDRRVYTLYGLTQTEIAIIEAAD